MARYGESSRLESVELIPPPLPWDSRTSGAAAKGDGSCSRSVREALAAEHSLSWQRSRVLETLHTPPARDHSLPLLISFPRPALQQSIAQAVAVGLLGP